jgi:hypothetical protein
MSYEDFCFRRFISCLTTREVTSRILTTSYTPGSEILLSLVSLLSFLGQFEPTLKVHGKWDAINMTQGYALNEHSKQIF